MNKVIISGNLCREIEVKQTTNGKAVLTNCVAVQRDYKKENGEYDSDFINIVAWGAQAEYLGKYAHKGNMVEIVGRWTVRKYETQKGEKRTVHECNVESIKVLTRQPMQETNTYIPDAYTQPQYEEMATDQDLPF